MSEPTWINQEKIYQEQVRKMREETSRIHATQEYIAFANEIARQDAIEAGELPNLAAVKAAAAAAATAACVVSAPAKTFCIPLTADTASAHPLQLPLFSSAAWARAR